MNLSLLLESHLSWWPSLDVLIIKNTCSLAANHGLLSLHVMAAKVKINKKKSNSAKIRTCTGMARQTEDHIWTVNGERSKNNP